MSRPVELPWRCSGRGDCCRQLEVVMTQEERALVLRVAPEDRRPLWKPDRDGFAVMKGAPCPFLTDDVRCAIYEHRPFNCRRFRCYRVGNEPWEVDEHGNCRNVTERLIQSREIRRDYELKQRKAQRFALANGWKP